LDIGTTTTDVIPLNDGSPVPAGRTDPERLRSGELVYTGVRRTPVCALGGDEALAAEWFATTLDVYLVLEMTAADASHRHTVAVRVPPPPPPAAGPAGPGPPRPPHGAAGRRPRAARLYPRRGARMGGAARRVADRLPGPPRTVLLSGSGEFLARKVLARKGVL